MELEWLILLFTGISTSAELLQKKSSKIRSRIINGRSTEIENFPYQLSIQIDNVHRCGASLISVNRALTAGHCVNFSKLDRYVVLAGSKTVIKTDSESIACGVIKAIVHPEFNRYEHYHELAVLWLNQTLPRTRRIQSIALPTLEIEIKPGKIGWIAGWGRTIEDDEAQSIELNALQVPIVDINICNRTYFGRLPRTVICAGYVEGGKDACAGDSGGPFVIDGVQEGIISWGKGCAHENFVGVYTRVASYIEWIHSVC